MGHTLRSVRAGSQEREKKSGNHCHWMKVEERMKSGARTAEFGREINPPPKSQLISSETRQTLNSLSTLYIYITSWKQNNTDEKGVQRKTNFHFSHRGLQHE